MANVYAELGEITAITKSMRRYADDISYINKMIDATLETLNSESAGRFAEDLKTAACSLIDFAGDLVNALVSGLDVLFDLAETLSRTDEDGANSLNSSRIYGR